MTRKCCSSVAVELTECLSKPLHQRHRLKEIFPKLLQRWDKSMRPIHYRPPYPVRDDEFLSTHPVRFLKKKKPNKNNPSLHRPPPYLPRLEIEVVFFLCYRLPRKPKVEELIDLED